MIGEWSYHVLDFGKLFDGHFGVGQVVYSGHHGSIGSFPYNLDRLISLWQLERLAIEFVCLSLLNFHFGLLSYI